MASLRSPLVTPFSKHLYILRSYNTKKAISMPVQSALLTGSLLRTANRCVLPCLSQIVVLNVVQLRLRRPVHVKSAGYSRFAALATRPGEKIGLYAARYRPGTPCAPIPSVFSDGCPTIRMLPQFVDRGTDRVRDWNEVCRVIGSSTPTTTLCLPALSSRSKAATYLSPRRVS